MTIAQREAASVARAASQYWAVVEASRAQFAALVPLPCDQTDPDLLPAYEEINEAETWQAAPDAEDWRELFDTDPDGEFAPPPALRYNHGATIADRARPFLAPINARHVSAPALARHAPAKLAGAPLPDGHAAALDNYARQRAAARIPSALQQNLTTDVPDAKGQYSLTL